MTAMAPKYSQFRYVILPARPDVGFAPRELYNKAYEYWKEYWQRTFKLKAPTFWNPIDFFRQDLVYCLISGDEIAAQNLSTIAHADNSLTFDLPYFRAYAGTAEDLIKQAGAKSLMTVEYTSVHRNFGERNTGLRLAEIMNGLALETFQAQGFDATFAMPRRLSGLSEVTANYGYRKVAESFPKAGWNLDVFLGFNGEILKHPDPEYAEVIRHLWETRIDYSSLSRPRVGGTTSPQESTMAVSIRDQYQETMQEFCARFDQLDWSDRRVYAMWLAQAYYLVRHTTRLLSLCAGYCPFEYEATHLRLIEHTQEEKGHDNIGLADLTALGVSLKDLPELAETSSLIQLQYDQMKDLSACSFFGYILLLEGLAVMRAKELGDKVAASFGPRTARFLKVHGEDDIEHIEQALKQIETFDAEDQQFAMDNLRSSARIYHTMLDRIEQSARDLPVASTESRASL